MTDTKAERTRQSKWSPALRKKLGQMDRGILEILRERLGEQRDEMKKAGVQMEDKDQLETVVLALTVDSYCKARDTGRTDMTVEECFGIERDAVGAAHERQLGEPLFGGNGLSLLLMDLPDDKSGSYHRKLILGFLPKSMAHFGKMLAEELGQD